jgi:hypothetical protein
MSRDLFNSILTLYQITAGKYSILLTLLGYTLFQARDPNQCFTKSQTIATALPWHQPEFLSPSKLNLEPVPTPYRSSIALSNRYLRMLSPLPWFLRSVRI